MQFLEAKKLTYLPILWYMYKYHFMTLGNHTWADSVWISYSHTVSSHATDTRKSAQNNQNLMNSPLWQIHEPYKQCSAPNNQFKEEQDTVHWPSDNTMSTLAEYRNVWKILSFGMWSPVDRYILHSPSTLKTEAASYFETVLLQCTAPYPGRQYWSWAPRMWQPQFQQTELMVF